LDVRHAARFGHGRTNVKEINVDYAWAGSERQWMFACYGLLPLHYEALYLTLDKAFTDQSDICRTFPAFLLGSENSRNSQLYNNLSGGTCAGRRKAYRKITATHTGAETQAALPAQNSFAASNRTAQHSRSGVSVSTPGSLPGDPLNDPENPRYGSAVEAEVVPELDSARVWWRCGNGAAETLSDLGIKRGGITANRDGQNHALHIFNQQQNTNHKG
jgi:hypothetical protein